MNDLGFKFSEQNEFFVVPGSYYGGLFKLQLGYEVLFNALANVNHTHIDSITIRHGRLTASN
ncbi:hypothetical protein BpHYR1_019733 [Brachionus plicatilis]|uniref:Uncharacterized protein n=1 Tax=Brachionus plicatilis TaxID=10195 RepID=A0A3M7PXS0_BRAPC|nr:hypothetical protein BpHYR1_019733 [Brachionus plicatilis]